MYSRSHFEVFLPVHHHWKTFWRCSWDLITIGRSFAWTLIKIFPSEVKMNAALSLKVLACAADFCSPLWVGYSFLFDEFSPEYQRLRRRLPDKLSFDLWWIPDIILKQHPLLVCRRGWWTSRSYFVLALDMRNSLNDFFIDRCPKALEKFIKQYHLIIRLVFWIGKPSDRKAVCKLSLFKLIDLKVRRSVFMFINFISFFIPSSILLKFSLISANSRANSLFVVLAVVWMSAASESSVVIFTFFCFSTSFSGLSGNTWSRVRLSVGISSHSLCISGSGVVLPAKNFQFRFIWIWSLIHSFLFLDHYLRIEGSIISSLGDFGVLMLCI